MTRDEALAACEATVRRFDPDRYFASLFAPANIRPLLFALYAFHHELARINEIAREPMMADIRLQWWRDAVEGARRGAPPRHPAAAGLAEIFARASPPPALFEQLIDAYAPDHLPVLSSDAPLIEAFAETTSATLMRLGAILLGDEAAPAGMFRDAGIAYGLARILGGFPFYTARSNTRDPALLLRTVGKLCGTARDHLDRARKTPVPRRAFPAVLPAALVPSYLARAVRIRDPLRERIALSPLRRQVVLLRAAMLGRL